MLGQRVHPSAAGLGLKLVGPLGDPEDDNHQRQGYCVQETPEIITPHFVLFDRMEA